MQILFKTQISLFCQEIFELFYLSFCSIKRLFGITRLCTIKIFVAWFKHPFEKAIKKWDDYEYVEVCQFETLQQLFHVRFVEGKRRLDLFKGLGLTHKKLSKQKPRTVLPLLLEDVI
jgi:hypothetical protein